VTLVEVLAGLLLLGTVLASALIARGRFLRQWAEADQRLAAARAADAMLATWLGAPASSLAVPAQGVVPDLQGYSWRTRWAPKTRDGDSLRVAVARLEIFGPRGAGGEERSNQPLVSVEFLLHVTPIPPPVQEAPR